MSNIKLSQARGRFQWEMVKFPTPTGLIQVSFLPFAEDLEHWGEVENGGDGWKVEELPGDFGKEFPSEEVHKYFVTSYE